MTRYTPNSIADEFDEFEEDDVVEQIRTSNETRETIIRTIHFVEFIVIWVTLWKLVPRSILYTDESVNTKFTWWFIAGSLILLAYFITRFFVLTLLDDSFMFPVGYLLGFGILALVYVSRERQPIVDELLKRKWPGTWLDPKADKMRAEFERQMANVHRGTQSSIMDALDLYLEERGKRTRLGPGDVIESERDLTPPDIDQFRGTERYDPAELQERARQYREGELRRW
jgi:hypothetical protein